MNKQFLHLILFLAFAMACQASGFLEKPFGDRPLIKTVSNLPAHEAVQVSFVLEVVGTWDGVGYYGPSNWLCEIDGKQAFTGPKRKKILNKLIVSMN